MRSDCMNTGMNIISRKHILKVVFSVFFLLLMVAPDLYSQSVGLVLSGGGAKGAAHIGVIRALEEEGIPIDFVAGTSMGAIIGGLYAIGWSPDQMEEVMLSDEFEKWVEGEIGEEYKFYFKKPKPNASWLSLRFSVDSVLKPRLPVNLVSPVVMDFVFTELFSAAAAAAGYNFDSLFVPFRCVAADVVENKALALHKGNLGNAIRASMTFPFYFKPIKIDGRLLFDGGMYNNFPADIMYDEFFPEIIIGSRASMGFGKMREDDLTSQLEAMLTSETNYEVPCDNGVLIEPTLRAVNVIDFRHTRAFIDSGYVAAKRMIPEIRAFVYDTISLEELERKRQAFRAIQPPLIIDRIYVEGIDENQTQYVNRMLKLGEEMVPMEKMKKEYFKLVADEKINHIFPQLKFNYATGFFDMHLDVRREKDITVEFGGNVSSAPINSAYLGIIYNLLGVHAINASLNSYIGRFYSSAQVAVRADFSTAVPVYLEPVLTFNQWDYFKASTYFFEDKTPSYLQQNEINWQLNAGIPLRNRSKLVWGMGSFRNRDEYYQTNFFTRTDTADQTRLNGFSPYLLFEMNTLNYKQYANQGRFFQASARLVSATEKHTPGSTSLRNIPMEKKHIWWQFKMKHERFFEVNSFYRIGTLGELVVSNQETFTNYTATMLSAPAFHPVPESKTKFSPAYRAHTYAATGFRNIFLLRRNLDFRLEAYAFLPYRPILQDDNFLAQYASMFSRVNLAGSAAMVFHTPVGPVSVSLNYFDRNEDPFSVLLNLGYIIFNQRAMD
jgi:NTE family protein